jgi:hypothetical protein
MSIRHLKEEVMTLKNLHWAGVSLAALLCVVPPCLHAQITVVDTKWMVHSRSMLHETVYNTGEICQPYQTGKLTVADVTNPMMEWPPYYRTTVDRIEYAGQNNAFGGGVYISANYKGSTGTRADLTSNRVVALCGGVGGASAEQAFNVWSFPVSINRIENFPVLANGSLNSAFNPNEAEEIITAKWNTSAGISVTRTSRSYSYPDYDDFIIFEYEFENNGVFVDKTSGSLVHRDTTLVDVLITFTYGISPSMFGYTRSMGDPKWQPHSKTKYTMSFWDPDYNLLYNQMSSSTDPLSGWPEQNADNFLTWSRSGKYGGGILSPQAAGYSVMYYDTDHLSVIDTVDAARNQSPQYVTVRNGTLGSKMKYTDLDEAGKVKQPYQAYQSNTGMASSKIFQNAIDFAQRPSAFYAGGTLLPPIWTGRNIPLNSDNNVGGANFPVRTMSYGPYYLKPGDKIRFTTAEIVGYGADTNKSVIGGFYNTSNPWHPGRFWNQPVQVGGQTVTKNYVAEFGLPDYVNSNVVTVNDVAHKAYEAYQGHSIRMPKDSSTSTPGPLWDYNNPPTWPEINPAHGSYKVPIPVPAPAITVLNTDTNAVAIGWGRDVEQFEKNFPGSVTGPLARFNVYRSDFKSGPWKLLGTVNKGSVNGLGLYGFYDTDRQFLIGESKYYTVTSVDASGHESGKTNTYLHNKLIGPVSKMTKVQIVPNPYNATQGSGFSGEGASNRLGIYGLPAKCTVHFYSFAGQKLWTIEHDEQSYSHNFELITRNAQEIASGVYFFVVLTPEGDKYMGKFVIVK